MNKTQQPIGVFDSGVGGISTMRVLAKMLPNENFFFYGDSRNAPYGDKSQSTVYHLSKAPVQHLVDQKVKAVVIACNTATSAAKPQLVADFDTMPILGIEPALKQAVDAGNQHILVLGTELTLHLPKYQQQVQRFTDRAEIESIPCPGLADLVEKGDAAVPDIRTLLAETFKGHDSKKYDAVVLGCTHYPFVADLIQAALGHELNVYTGFDGLGNNLKQQLAEQGLLRTDQHSQQVRFMSSTDTEAELALYRHLFDHGIDNSRN